MSVPIAWTSSDTAIVKIDSTGLARGIRLGWAEIIATAQRASQRLLVTVTTASRAVTRVLLTASSDKFLLGDTVRFRAAAYIGDALVSVPIVWTSSDTSIVKIDSTGLARGIKLGSADITAATEGASAKFPVIVTNEFSLQPGPQPALIAPGGRSTCALASTDVYCWGWNLSSALGTADTAIELLTPRRVTGGIPFRAIVGENTQGWHSVPFSGLPLICGLSQAGHAYCWGKSNASPHPVEGGIVFTSLAAGAHHLCGAGADGYAYCWGYNYDGEVVSTDIGFYVSVPRRVDLPERIAAVAAGQNHSCALSSSGTAYCWGRLGPWLGTGAGLQVGGATLPKPVSGDVKFARITAAFDHTCALTMQSEAYCWGEQVGPNATEYRVPTPVAHSLRFKAITTAHHHICGLTADGTAYCWGSGLLGDGTTQYRLEPRPVATNVKFATIVSETIHDCGIATTGEAYCWGHRIGGQLGNGYSLYRPTPVLVAGGLRFAMLSTAGNYYSFSQRPLLGFNGSACGLTTAGRAYCWGANYSGQLGDGTTTARFAPVPVASSATFRAISAGQQITCGLESTGAAACWGNIGLPGLPMRTTRTFASITTGRDHACALESDGAAYCWGRNEHGQLGTADFVSRSEPWLVAGGLRFLRISASDRFTCGISAAREIYCWGSEDTGRLGPITATYRCATGSRTGSTVRCANAPQKIPGMSGIAAISTSPLNTCILDGQGNVYCWGDTWPARFAQNEIGLGELPRECVPGAGPIYCTLQPVVVQGDRRFTALDGMSALDATGAMFRFKGEAGRFTSVPIADGSTFVALAARGSPCGLVPSGEAYCWGLTDVGQTGDGQPSEDPVPVRVVSPVRFSTHE